MKTLFKNCNILLREAGVYRMMAHAFLAVDGDTISYIGTSEPSELFDCVKDYSGKLLMPGLYNCHTHSPMVLFRGIGNDLPLEKWLNESIFPLERKLTKEQIRAASYLAQMEMIASGTVSFTDMYFFPEITAATLTQSGMKANLTKQLQFSAQNPKTISDSIAFIKEFDGEADGRILTDFGIHSCYTCTFEDAQAYSAICCESAGRIHIHLSETEQEYRNCLAQTGLTPTAWFEKAGALCENTIAAHCVVLNEEDRSILSKHRVTAVHCPTSNLKLGSGLAPIAELYDRGLNLTLGTDGAASNNNLNLFEEMHLAALLHKGRLHDPTVMPVDTVLDMASVNAAKAQGRSNCGELRRGFKADIIALDLDKPHYWGNAFDKSLLLYAAQASDVCLTMVDGKILYENGEFYTIDKEKALFEIKPD